jgi:hypothetical protein
MMVNIIFDMIASETTERYYIIIDIGQPRRSAGAGWASFLGRGKANT